MIFPQLGITDRTAADPLTDKQISLCLTRYCVRTHAYVVRLMCGKRRTNQPLMRCLIAVVSGPRTVSVAIAIQFS